MASAAEPSKGSARGGGGGASIQSRAVEPFSCAASKGAGEGEESA